MARILIVDDENRMGEVLGRSLARRGHEIYTALNGGQALEVLAQHSVDLVFSDQRMEPVDGMELLQRVREGWPQVRFVMMTAYGEVERAVAAMKAGASHYLTKPVDLEELHLLAERLVAEQELERENARLRQVIHRGSERWELVGESAAMQQVRDLILRVAPSDATVLIRGESGTGKELAARAIHRHSHRKSGPFVAVNCAAIPDTLLESELFGYVKGAFTGADQDKEGLFELARQGTIFLDEIAEANAAVQAKLLRALEERRFIPVGGRSETEVDVRIVAATNKDLEKLIVEERFREDLFYRFNVFPLHMPPLRARLEDLPDLARSLLQDLGRGPAELPSAVLAELRTHPWPGNVRELRNVLERAHILAGASPLTAEDILLPASSPHSLAGAEPTDLNLVNHERRLIEIALRRSRGNKTRAAELLGLTRRALYSHMERLRIPVDFPDVEDGP